MTRMRALAFCAVLLIAATILLYADSRHAGARRNSALEFHILASDWGDPACIEMLDRMIPSGPGPAPEAGDTKYRWIEVAHHEQFDPAGVPPKTFEWKGKYYLLAMMTPDAAMSGDSDWGIDRVYATTDSLGNPCVGLAFDEAGTKQFADLTARWQPQIDQRFELAIVVSGKIISAPWINSSIPGGSCFITGGVHGFSRQEEENIVEALGGEVGQAAGGQ